MKITQDKFLKFWLLLLWIYLHRAGTISIIKWY